jgi:hypothetical protein
MAYVPKYWNNWNLGTKRDSVEFNLWRKNRFSSASTSTTDLTSSNINSSINSSINSCTNSNSKKTRKTPVLPKYSIEPCPLRRVLSFPLLSSQLKKKPKTIPCVDLTNFKMFVIKKYRYKDKKKRSFVPP